MAEFLSDRVFEDLKAARKSGDAVRVKVLSYLLDALRKEEKAKPNLPMQAQIAVVRRLVKQSQEVLEAARAGGREDAVGQELAAQAIYGEYLPATPSEEQVRDVVRQVISEMLPAPTQRQFGVVVKEALARLGPGAEGKRVSEVVKEMLP